MKAKICGILIALVLVLGFSLGIALPAAANGGNTYYVATTGDNGNNGLSWGTAWRDIQYALTQATSGDTINVATGTYTENITLKGGVNVYGAGAGNSIIDGSSSGTVVYASGLATATTLDGFTITNGSGYDDGGIICGGGMYIIDCSASLTVSNCIFSGNSTTDLGGGMYNKNSSPTVTGCDFIGNHSNQSGGGMYNALSSCPAVTDCTFDGNTVGNDCGGMLNAAGSNAVVTDCIFENHSSIAGSGMHNTSSSPIVVNCIFKNNAANIEGGGMRNNGGANAVVTNCTFYSNSSAAGAAMFNAASNPVVTNCILWDGGGGIEINNGGGATPVVTYCDVQGGYAGGTNIINSDPSFANAGAGDFHLQVGSPCINAGNNSATSLPTTDFEGDPRIANCTVDMGVDEADNNSPPNAPTDPLCEGVTNPTTVTDPTPEFSWTFSDPEVCNTQGAYQILVASTEAYLLAHNGDMWYSDKISSGASTVSYAGTTLAANTTYYWKVRTWDDYDACGDFCSPQHFTMGPDEVWVDDDYDAGTPGWGTTHFATIQDGIDAVIGSTVHVAAGAYNEDITLKDGVQVLGAGAGSTTITGTGGGPVVTADDVSFATLEGFTITGGNTNYGAGMYNHDNSYVTVNECTFDSNTSTGSGGGMYNDGCANMTVSDCTFSNNTCAWDGGGMGNANSHPTITGCTFYHNTSSEYGGGMNNNSSAPTVTNCIFDDNDATIDGAGVFNRYYFPEFINCTFRNNEATRNGGGVFNYYSTPTLTNCTFYSNTANTSGGGMYNNYSDTTATNCTFWGNTATTSGSGVYNNHSDAELTNCILWGDTSDEIADDTSSPAVTYCDVQGGYAGGTNIINSDPSFANAGAGDFHLQVGSPCINAGNNSAPDIPATDFEGDTRIANFTVDMGVDEYAPTPTEVWVDDDFNASTPGWGYDHFDSIQDGIDAVAPPATVHVAAGTYTENLTLKDGADVLGAGAGSSIIDGDGNGTVVYADGIGAATTFDGFTVQNGSGYGLVSQSYGGGMYVIDSSALTVTNCTFSGNSASHVGGGMYTYNSPITVTDCAFNTNSANNGGGMDNNNSSPTLDTCTFTGNTASLYGGGIGNSNTASPTLTGCTFTDNVATNGGGGMFNMNASNAQLTNCAFNTNQSPDGAGMYNWSSSPTLDTCTFTSNPATSYGGGIYNGRLLSGDPSSDPTLTNCTFTSNSANNGGGIYNTGDSSATLTNCTFTGNTAIYGGGMDNTSSSPEVTGCTFSANVVTWNGGGMYNYNSSPEVTNCIFTGNSTTTTCGGNGGGMFSINNSSPVVTNCIFSSNTSDNGAGMTNYQSTTTVTNCTFYGNTANSCGGVGGGMLNQNSAVVTVNNCILWGDSPQEIFNAGGTTVTVSYCDVQGGYGGTGNINIDPLFVNAAGSDFHLQANSLCIDAGSNAAPSLPSADFEGDPRIMAGNDAGTATVDMGVDECLAQVWVDDDWVGTPDGTEVQPGKFFGTNAFDNVQDGVDAVVSGGKVSVYDGKYTENVTITDKSLTVESVSGNWQDAIIDLPAYVIGLLGAGGNQFSGDVTISGFTLSSSGNGVYIPYGLAAGSSVSVNNCFIYDNSEAGIYAAGILQGGIFIDDCIITQNGTSGGIRFSDIQGTAQITDSVIGAYWDGTTSYAANNGNGILIGTINTTGNVVIDNNKIVANVGNGIADGISGCYGRLTISNNTIGAYDYDLASGNGYFDGNSSNGIYIDNVASNSVVTIEGNRIAQNTEDGISFDNIDGGVTIDNNYIGARTDYTAVGGTLYTRTYAGNTEAGMYVNNLTSNGSLTILNNKIAENTEAGLHVHATAGGIVILANHVGAWTQDIPGGSPVNYTGNGNSGIVVDDVTGGNLLIKVNTITQNAGTATGIHIGSAANTASVGINLNNILANDGNGLSYSYGGASYIENLDGEHNWWGAASGPGGAGPGTGDEVSTHVDYTPWLEVSVTGAKAGTITNGTLDNIAGGGVEAIVTGTATVTTAGYSGNPGNSFSGDIDNYVDVFIDDDAGVTEIEIRLYYTDADIEGVLETSLAMNWWDGTSWVVCSNSGVNTTDAPPYSGYIWAKIRVDTTPSLADLIGSVFGGLGYVPAPSGGSTAPRISNVASTCYEGVTETTADICWTTNEKSTSQVKYWASPIQLSPLDETLVTEHHVQLTGLTPGTTYYYKAMSKDKTGNLTVSAIQSFTTLDGASPSAIFASSDLAISPDEVAIGETITVSVLVTNSGNAAGSHELTLEINGVAEETKEITLQADTSQGVSFTVSREEAGSYSVAVDGLSGSFNVTAPENTAQDGGVAKVTEEEGSTNWPVLGGVIAAVVIALIIIIVVRRRAY